jgi:methylated-DNA-protein-cysteine methyltransferase related protein
MPAAKKKLKDNFFENVYEVVRLVPKGRVTTYGAVAAYLGAKSSSRMVGWAMFGCPKGVPAHRVVNRTGLLTGKHHFAKPDMMEKLLKKEGVKVVGDKVKDFKLIFWDPAIELGM